MRELDLQVQNAIDTMDSKVETFFKEAKDAKPEVRKQEYNKIKENYDKVLEDADEKVTMASQIFDLVDRHLRKLDQELSKFKMELEADCAGITEILEKRSMMYDQSSSSDHFNYASPYQNSHEPREKKKNEIDRFTMLNGFASSSSREPSVQSPLQPPPYNSLPASPQTAIQDYPTSSGSSLSYTLGQVGAGSAAIAAAAAQAVTSTMQQHQARRGAQASFKASVATAMKAEQLSNSLQSLLGPVSTSLTRNQNYVDVISSNRYQTSSIPPKITTDAIMASQHQSSKSRKRNHRSVTTTPVATPLAPVVEDQAMGSSSLDWVPEPNEPTYCLCNQVSYGEMVGCDNPDCPIEWFHYGCVGLTDAPEGKWYCPRCTARMKKKKTR
eukprot:gene6003-6701_t